MRRKLKVGLALGGGAARGIAHIGVLRVLEEEGIPVHIITGTSMGALIGALYAWHCNTEKVIEFIKGMIESKRFKEVSPFYFDDGSGVGAGFYYRFLHLFKKGIVFAKSIAQKSLIGEKDYRSIIYEIFGEIKIEDLKLPFGCVATDIASGRGILISKGPVIDAICASCAIPGVLPTIRIDGKDMIDGGIVENIPVLSARRIGADIVVSVNVSKNVEEIEELFNLENAIDVVFRAHDAARNSIDEIMMNMSDIAIRPPVGDIHWADFSSFHECILRGEKEAREKVPLIKKLIYPKVWSKAFWIPETRPRDAENVPHARDLRRIKIPREGPNIGLSISGGTFHGPFHVGVIKAFEMHGIKINVMTCTGVGAIFGALYLLSKDSLELEIRIKELIDTDLFRRITMDIPSDWEETTGFLGSLKKYLKKRTYYTLSMTRRSLLSREEYESAIEEIFPDIDIKDLPVPFGCVALDLFSGREVTITDGSLRRAIMASAARPGISPPLEGNGRLLVDGSWVSGIPVKLAKALGANVVLASFTEMEIGETKRIDCALDIVVRGIELTRRAMDELKMKEADFVLRPKAPFPASVTIDIDHLIKEGEAAFEEVSERLQGFLHKRKWKFPIYSFLRRRK